MYANSDIGPGKGYFAITPSDTVNLLSHARLVYVGTAGDITAVGPDGIAVLHKAVPQGTYLQGAVARINLTGTTAADLVGLR